MNWKNKKIDIGLVSENTTTEVQFISLEPLDIDHVEPSCGSCTKFIDYKNNILTLHFKTQKPKHLIGKVTPISKYVTVYYTDGSSDKLTFTGTLNK